MDSPVWGSLAKSQEDAETIEEAIARLITDHDDDSNAHIGTGKSLENHKKAETIDHLAESIVEDKYADKSITPPKLYQEKYAISTNWQTLDNLSISAGGWIDEYSDCIDACASEADNDLIIRFEQFLTTISLSKNPEIEFHAKCSLTGDSWAEIVYGRTEHYDGFNGFGFKFINSAVYAYHTYNDGEDVTHIVTTLLSGIDADESHIYRAKKIDGENEIKFYVDNVLKATHSTNLPNYFQEDDIIGIEVYAEDAGNQGISTNFLQLIQDW